MAESIDRFRQSFRVGWGDLDGNHHMANRAFLDRAADTRVLFFAHHGFSVSRFAAERIGPVILRDELVYRKELRLLDEFTVDLEAFGLSSDGTRFDLGNTFRIGEDVVAAVVRSEGLWFDLDKRRPRAPPPELDAVERKMPRGEGFRELPLRSR
jgi:acyl-CoA thioester hydrolase